MSDVESVKFTAVSPDFLDACWDRAKPIMEKACEISNGRFTADSVKEQLDMGIQILWILYQGDDDMLLVLTVKVLIGMIIEKRLFHPLLSGQRCRIAAE